jgi:hypothetical protein
MAKKQRCAYTEEFRSEAVRGLSDRSGGSLGFPLGSPAFVVMGLPTIHPAFILVALPSLFFWPRVHFCIPRQLQVTHSVKQLARDGIGAGIIVR